MAVLDPANHRIGCYGHTCCLNKSLLINSILGDPNAVGIGHCRPALGQKPQRLGRYILKLCGEYICPLPQLRKRIKVIVGCNDDVIRNLTCRAIGVRIKHRDSEPQLMGGLNHHPAKLATPQQTDHCHRPDHCHTIRRRTRQYPVLHSSTAQPVSAVNETQPIARARNHPHRQAWQLNEAQR